MPKKTRGTWRAQTSEMRRPVPYAVISNAWCLMERTDASSRSTSPRASTSGSFCGILGYVRRATTSGRPSTAS